MKNQETILGVIGGSGVYEIDGLKNTQWKKINSSFGEPSDSLLFGELDGQKMVFLPRHGRGHRIPPSEVNYRANIDVLKRAGVTDVISVSAVGSLREDLRPGMFVIIDQFIDRTFERKKSFFGPGLVAHVSMAHPVCNRLGHHIEQIANDASIKTVRGGTYIAMEGPQFSSVAESELYRSWGCDVVGMTNMPEAKLAREAELCYVSVAMVTDYDCWHPNHDNVSVESMIKVLSDNADNARYLVKKVAPIIDADSKSAECICKESLNNAIITQQNFRDKKLVRKLEAIAGRVLNNN
ncbi:S-methyl-5'-thioadenosine phosphorylase [Candidatus Pseudothioglobus singularis]|uniref:S-methyl-5'-thioadenosine phosphorylase n=1 Tax=Candidatus Pseudothioglobus singularis PS1 TaxID=1125411 RepID=A0A0M5L0G0_9GAMM|nr:S-methyl-5'-thioadenosine phosphorylase [Candidatus Pseudothioglobus singularis]ALE02310.1 5'-methylthioadenosine phosphorylase [Candidatus Pseudothioglobus singularis PS1]